MGYKMKDFKFKQKKWVIYKVIIRAENQEKAQFRYDVLYGIKHDH